MRKIAQSSLNLYKQMFFAKRLFVKVLESRFLVISEIYLYENSNTLDSNGKSFDISKGCGKYACDSRIWIMK